MQSRDPEQVWEDDGGAVLAERVRLAKWLGLIVLVTELAFVLLVVAHCGEAGL